MVNLTTFGFALKQHYTSDPVKASTYKDQPGLSMLRQETDTNWRGSVLPVPVIYGANQGVSATFANAQGNISGVAGISFQLTRGQVYGVSQIDRLTLMASDAAPDDAWLKARLAEMEETRNQILNELSFQLYNDGTGSRSQVSSGATAGLATITLSNSSDVVRFFPNQVLVMGPNENGTSLRTGSATVLGVNRNAGTITFSAALNTLITGASDNDYFFLQGSVGTTLNFTGLAGWLPFTAPSSTDSFFGTNRSIDSGLYGTIYDGSSEEIQEALIDGLETIERIGGGTPDVVLMNNIQFAKLKKSMGTQVRYMDVEAKAVEGLSFKAIEVFASKGPVAVLPDRMAPPNYAYALETEDWAVKSTGEVPDLVSEDGVTMLRVYNADAFEIRQAAYGNFRCEVPAHSGVIKLQYP